MTDTETDHPERMKREQRWLEQIEFEKQNEGTTCDSCWMLIEIYEALQEARATDMQKKEREQ